MRSRHRIHRTIEHLATEERERQRGSRIAGRQRPVVSAALRNVDSGRRAGPTARGTRSHTNVMPDLSRDRSDDDFAVRMPMTPWPEGSACVRGRHQKDVVVTNKLYAGHVDWTTRLQSWHPAGAPRMRVDGMPRSFETIMKDPQFLYLLSDEAQSPCCVRQVTAELLR